MSGYRIGITMPGLITDILSYIVVLLINTVDIVYASIFLIYIAIGDFTILFTLIKVDKTIIVEDHPTMCGCTVYSKK